MINPSTRSNLTHVVTVLVSLTFAVLVGCGDSGPQRVEVTGSVSWKGKPLDQGSLVLEPLDVKSGIATGIEIRNGEFLIPADRGPTPGDYRIKILSYQPTGRQIKDEDAGGMTEEVQQVIPSRYNVESELTARIPDDLDGGLQLTLEGS